MANDDHINSIYIIGGYEPLTIFAKSFIKDIWKSSKLTKRQSCDHIETSYLIYSLNRLTGFYMIATSAFNELRTLPIQENWRDSKHDNCCKKSALYLFYSNIYSLSKSFEDFQFWLKLISAIGRHYAKE